ncbi:unnamed protein product [Choristocarpus tenellus]
MVRSASAMEMDTPSGFTVPVGDFLVYGKYELVTDGSVVGVLQYSQPTNTTVVSDGRLNCDIFHESGLTGKALGFAYATSDGQTNRIQSKNTIAFGTNSARGTRCDKI